MSEDNVMSPADELDFSNDGIQTAEHEFEIVSADETEKENGKQVSVGFKTEALPFVVTSRFWVRHTNPKAQEIGRSNGKKIAIAALGAPSFGPAGLEGLIGKRVLATVSEDKNGFTQINKFKALPESAS